MFSIFVPMRLCLLKIKRIWIRNLQKNMDEEDNYDDKVYKLNTMIFMI